MALTNDRETQDSTHMKLDEEGNGRIVYPDGRQSESFHSLDGALGVIRCEAVAERLTPAEVEKIEEEIDQSPLHAHDK
ncbi:MAG: hypothetical protein NUV49_04265 [Patescibacteria group bacterium]|nr:hypothetical protein [Patescibacteria group bacterium]